MKKDVYTFRPLTREEWAALDPANRYRARIHKADGTRFDLIWRRTLAEAEADLAENLPEFRAMCKRCPYLVKVTGGDVEDRGERLPCNCGLCGLAEDTDDDRRDVPARIRAHFQHA